MAKKKVKKQDWEIIDTPYGQWEYPGAITRIPSNDITMQGVPYPVLGVSDTNDIQMMYPNQDYQFDGSSVTEYPVMEPGGRPPIITHNPNDPRLRAYNDSVLVSQIGDRARKYIKQFPGEDQWVGDYLPRWEDRNADISKAWNRLGKVNKTFPKPSNITSIYTDSHIYDYEKPVQPVLYRPNEKIELNSMEGNLQSQPIDLGNINPLPFEPGSYFTRERKPQEADRGKMEYFDKKTGRSIGLYANGGRIPKAQIGTLTPGSSIGIDMPTDLEPLTGLDLAFSKQERIPIQGNEELYNTVINNPKRYNFRIVDGRFFNYLPKEETPIQIKSKKPDLLQSQSTTPRKLEFTRERQPGERFSALYTPQGQKYSAIDVNDKSGKLIRTVDPKTGKIAFKHPVTGEEQFEYGGELPEAGSGYKVVRSSERKGKTHKVTGPDGTVKFFGDSKLGQHPKDPERKKAFYARHKKNLAGNPYFRAFARKTWAEGGELNDWEIMQEGGDLFQVENKNYPTSFRELENKMMRTPQNLSYSLADRILRGANISLGGGHNDNKDALRHSGTAMYSTSAQGPLLAPFKIPYTNLLGLAHEAKGFVDTYSNPNRKKTWTDFKQDLKETGSDLYNNFIGSTIGGLPISLDTKEKLLKKAHNNNLLSILEPSLSPEKQEQKTFFKRKEMEKSFNEMEKSFNEEELRNAQNSALRNKFKQVQTPPELKRGGKIKVKSNDWEIVSNNEWEII